jgi:hypothetical protein
LKERGKGANLFEVARSFWTASGMEVSFHGECEMNVLAWHEPARGTLKMTCALGKILSDIWRDLETYEHAGALGFELLVHYHLLKRYSKEGSRTSMGPSAAYNGLSMTSALTSSDRAQGGCFMPLPGEKRVRTPKATLAVSRAAASLGARTTADPRWELASQFGSSRSIGISLQTGMVTPYSRFRDKNVILMEA